jgi:hypothetical protein
MYSDINNKFSFSSVLVQYGRPTEICHACEPELYPKGKLIIDDYGAKKDSKGNWICSECQETERRKELLRIYGSNHVNTRSFLDYEDRQIRKWNQTVKKLGFGPIRRNKYTGRTPF